MSDRPVPSSSEVWKVIGPMTKLVCVYAVVIWLLAIGGFVLAFTVAPDAINMGLGCFLGGIPFTVVTGMMIYNDGIGVLWD